MYKKTNLGRFNIIDQATDEERNKTKNQKARPSHFINKLVRRANSIPYVLTIVLFNSSHIGVNTMNYLAILIVAHIFFQSVLGGNSSKYTFFVSVKQQDHFPTINSNFRQKHIKQTESITNLYVGGKC